MKKFKLTNFTAELVLRVAINFNRIYLYSAIY